jgi:hypothetical protein
VCLSVSKHGTYGPAGTLPYGTYFLFRSHAILVSEVPMFDLLTLARLNQEQTDREAALKAKMLCSVPKPVTPTNTEDKTNGNETK